MEGVESRHLIDLVVAVEEAEAGERIVKMSQMKAAGEAAEAEAEVEEAVLIRPIPLEV